MRGVSRLNSSLRVKLLGSAVAMAMLPAAAAVAAKPQPARVNPGHIVSLGGSTAPGAGESTIAFSPFSVTVANPADGAGNFDPTNVNLGAVPAGSYNFWTASVQWSPVTAPPNDPFSNEAFIALSPTPANNALNGVWYASGSPSNGAGNSAPTTLTWSGFMNFPYNGGGPLNFWGFQTFDGSTAQWNNVTINLSQQSGPAAPASTNAVVGGSTSGPISPGQVKWYKIHYNATAPLTIDTLGTTTTGGATDLPSDTELGLYSATGVLILQNDDINFSGGVYQSSITLDPSFMPAGDYWVAATGFATDYGNGQGFSVTSTSAQTGTLVLNGISIPEPASLGLVALVGVAMTARRRRNA